MNQHYDIAIVGGGIQGAGIAQAAAAAGFTCLLLEQGEWANGTSRCSSKLIHGGLRYLESAQWSLVHESLKEREILLRVAPELVKPQKFLIPIYQHSKRHSWQIRAGLTLYWLFNFKGQYRQFGTLPKSQWLDLHGLKQDGLKNIFWYWDAQTDDLLLTRAVVASAQELSATTMKHTQLVSAEKNNDGYQLQTQQGEQRQNFSCDILINATGPWINHTLARINPQAETLAIDLIQGAHLILRDKISDQVFYLESPDDHRAIFVMPWKDHSLLGTTESIFSGDPEKATASEEEEQYLLRTLQHYFPDYSPDVIDRFAGIRVLPKAQERAFSRPRETLLHCSPEHPNLISVYGGKLTGYRASAAKVVCLLEEKLGKKSCKADTRALQLKKPLDG